MITEYSEERRRNLIFDYFGDDARVRLLRRTPTFGAPVFVVDFDRGPRHFRTLGSFGAGAQVTEQSSMDLLYPARLVFHSLFAPTCPTARQPLSTPMRRSSPSPDAGSI